MTAGDSRDDLVSQLRIGTEFGELSDDAIRDLRRACGLPENMTLPEGYSSGGPFWAWHGPLLIGFGRIVYSASLPPWLDEVAVIPEYREEGIEAEIVYRLALSEAILTGEKTLLIFGAAKVPTTLGLLLRQHRNGPVPPE